MNKKDNLELHVETLKVSLIIAFSSERFIKLKTHLLVFLSGS